ncbi:hypothetical protein GGR51DRAFT_514529 [Nemania sp. FL0031]|nr:hypothetical protein GGR51DRAFT_514529 [Nemania sp. FL0031]
MLCLIFHADIIHGHLWEAILLAIANPMARTTYELLTAIPIICELGLGEKLDRHLMRVHTHLAKSSEQQSTKKLDRIANLLSCILSEPFLLSQLSISGTTTPTQGHPGNDTALSMLCELINIANPELISTDIFSNRSREVGYTYVTLYIALNSFLQDDGNLDESEIDEVLDIPLEYPWYNSDGDFQHDFNDPPFGGDHSIRNLALALYETLHQNLPCPCGDSHDGMLGSSTKAMLRLEPQWSWESHVTDRFFVIFNTTDADQESFVHLFDKREPKDLEMRACQIKTPAFDDNSPLCLTLQSDVEKFLWATGECNSAQILETDHSVETNSDVRTLRKILLSADIPFTLKRALGVTLARTLLHLFETQWMPGQWNSEDVLFICQQIDSDRVAPLLSHGQDCQDGQQGR